MTKILITSTSFGKKVPEPLEILKEKGYEIRLNELGHPLSPEELIERLEGCDGVIAGLDHFTAEVFEAVPELRVVARYGAGVDRVDLEAAKRAGVVVTNTPDANSDSVADLAVGLMLAVSRRIPFADRTVRAGQWQRVFGQSLSEKVVGLVGCGRIGSRVARRVRGFGCRVLVHDPYVDAKTAELLHVDLVDLDELFVTSDFISLHLPVTEATTGLVNADRFTQMKETAVLVNTARGELIDQEAMLAALREGTFGGAGLDVHIDEPCDPAPYEELDQVVLAPHMGSHSTEALANMAFGAVENLIEVLEDRPPINPVVLP